MRTPRPEPARNRRRRVDGRAAAAARHRTGRAEDRRQSGQRHPLGHDRVGSELNRLPVPQSAAQYIPVERGEQDLSGAGRVGRHPEADTGDMSGPLPWMAVLIANDAPPRVTEDTHRLTGEAPVRQRETRSHMIVDIPENR